MTALFLLALALAADAFAVSIARGAGGPHSLARALETGLAFGAAQGIMPLLGWGLGALFAGQPQQVADGMAQWDAANPQVLATISDMADHIDHVRAVAGIDHIGIGGDYDGMVTGPVGMEDVAGYPALFAELARRGYSRRDLEKIASGNMMRVLREAEAYAATLAGMAPLETPIG